MDDQRKWGLNWSSVIMQNRLHNVKTENLRVLAIHGDERGPARNMGFLSVYTCYYMGQDMFLFLKSL